MEMTKGRPFKKQHVICHAALVIIRNIHQDEVSISQDVQVITTSRALLPTCCGHVM